MRRLAQHCYLLVTLGFLSPRWQMACFATLGVAAGVGLALAKVSRATSYLSDDPATCVNCHVMRPQYSTWQHSSHFQVATCNDCHVPHQTVVHAYTFKARDGIYHASIFTARLEPQVIRMSQGAIPVVEGNCRRCHAAVIERVAIHQHQEADLRCWDCHREVPHGRTRSLSATPRVMAPELPPLLDRQVPTIGGRRPLSEEKSHEH